MLRRMRRERAFVAWAREAAIPVERLDARTDPRTLAPLAPIFDGKRFAFLGEANHFVHEKVDYRVLFLRFLHALGFRTVVEEIAWSDGVWIDRYLSSGDEAHLRRVGTYGSPPPPRVDRDDGPRGALARLLERQPAAALGAEGRRLDRALRALGGVRLLGLDVDYEAGAGYAHLEAWLDDAAGEATARLGAAVRRVPGESIAEERDRLHAVVASVDRDRPALENELGPDRVGAIRHALRTTALSLEYVRLSRDVPDLAALAPAMAHREAVMSEHLDELVAHAGAEERMVLLAHDLHLAREDDEITTADGVVAPGGGAQPSVGCRLARLHDDAIASVWMLEGRGHDCSPLPESSGRVTSPRGTLNALLSRVSRDCEAFALPTRSDDPRAALLGQPVDWMSMNGARFRCVIRDQTDVLFFVHRVGPLREDA